MVLVRETRSQGIARPRQRPTGPTTRRVGGGAYRGSGTETIAVHMPPGDREYGPTVVWCHALFGSHLETASYPGSELMRALVDQGMPVLCADLGGFATWSNDDAIDAVDDAIAYGASQFGTRTDRIALFGVSMGGGLAVNWAGRHISRVSWVYGLVPVLNTQALMDRDPAVQASVEAAYGGAGAWLAARPTHDPAQIAVSRPLAGLGDRLRIQASLDDELILNADYDPFMAETPAADLRWAHAGHQTAAFLDYAKLGRWARDTTQRYG